MTESELAATKRRCDVAEPGGLRTDALALCVEVQRLRTLLWRWVDCNSKRLKLEASGEPVDDFTRIMYHVDDATRKALRRGPAVEVVECEEQVEESAP